MNRSLAFFNTCTCEQYGQESGTAFRNRALPIKSRLDRLFHFAKAHGIVVVSTRCLQGGKAPPIGPVTSEELLVISPEETNCQWNRKLSDCSEILLERTPAPSPGGNFATRAFDVFCSNPTADELIQSLNIDQWVVFGISMQGCVASVARGLMKREKQVVVLSDAVTPSGGKWFSSSPEDVLEELRQEGARVETTDEFFARLTTEVNAS